MRRAAAARELPPPLELQCLKVLWALEEANVSRVQKALSRTLAYTTVMTLLERLVRRGLVSRRKSGRAFLYRPVTSPEIVRGLALQEFLERFFEGSRGQLLAYLENEQAPRFAAPPESSSLDTALL